MIRWENHAATEVTRAGPEGRKSLGTALVEPSLAHVQARIRQFDGDDRYYAAERAVALAFTQWPHNTDLDQILVKVVILNRLYSTNVFDIWTVARHILTLEIDGRLRSGDIALVEELATVKFNGKSRYLLSFAAKYCAWHEPEKFQIFDSLVESMLWQYQKQFAYGTFSREELRTYPRFLEIIDQFKSRFNLYSVSRKHLDKFLWIEGREAAVTKSESEPEPEPEPVPALVSAPELIAFAGDREQESWTTRMRKQPFQVRTVDGGIEFTPETGIARFVPADEIEAFCNEFCERQSFKTTDYHDTSWHSSYLLTLIDRFLQKRGQSGQAGS